ncbi:MAG: NifU family protein [Alphaproteobacteria bacterium]|jgi:Fe-S cluster biogenesis protein NfuA|nr:NifU family protein [Alphaproteobacteria bacterium]MDP7222867.1 NifU family protein [Alphaproteobacteria bacterium]
MFIQFEETPNPNTLKFLPGVKVLSSGTRDYQTIDDAGQSKLAQSLFQLTGVDGVFLATDFVSVTKTEDEDWDLLKPHILGVIMEHYASGLPVVDDEQTVSTDDLDEISLQIKELIDTRVKPSVAMDGGNIEFVSYDEGVAYLRLEGACSGCPSASITLKSGVENMLRHYVPEVVRVEAVNG